jgi:AP endonuclease-1
MNLNYSSLLTFTCLQAGAGNIIGGDFAHLAKIIDLITDKSRVGVCFDTCTCLPAFL